MRNKNIIKSIGFKALTIVLFSAFFFVQLQAAFIARTNYDSPSTIGSANQLSSFKGSNYKSTATSIVAKFRLNKRYQSSSPFVLVKIAEPTLVFSVIKTEECISPPFVDVSQFLQTDRLRGPPCFSQL